jgi:small-conductance mechanosensitive channel/CRP-like cAMP-binding protein
MTSQQSSAFRSSTTKSAGSLVFLCAVPLVAMVLIYFFEWKVEWPWIDRDLLRKITVSCHILAGTMLVYVIACPLLIDRVLVASRKRPIPKLLRHLVTIGIATVAVLLVAYTVAPEVFSGILALSGILGVVLGLALKPLILDVFCGISTNLDSAFQIGDWIEIGSRSDGQPHAGWVEEINWRTTHIRTRTGNLVICPNSVVSNAVIANFSRPWPLSRCDTNVQLPAEVDPARVFRILRAAADATVGMGNGPSQERSSEVLILKFTDGTVIYQIRSWIDYSRISADAHRHLIHDSVLRHLRIAGIPLAEPAVLNRQSRDIAVASSAGGLHQLLSRLSIFQGIGPEDIAELAASLTLRNFEKGDVLVRQGEEGSEMFVITEGAVEVLANVDGAEVGVARMHAGDYFGEMSMLTGESRTATVRATSSGRVYSIPREGMAQLLTGDAPLMELMSRNLVVRNLSRASKIDAAQAENPEERRSSLASSLLAKMRRIFGSPN